MIVPGFETLQKFKISGEIGCVAPGTMKTKSIGDVADKESYRNITIWQGADGIYMFDGKSPIPIHSEIEDVFDQKNSYAINPDKIGDSRGEFDFYGNYHWFYASGTSTTLNKERCYNVSESSWYEIDRSSALALQEMTRVSDTNGNVYAYGFVDTGYMERLDNGTTFDGNDMTFTFRIGDITLSDSILITTSINHVGLYCVAKNTTTNTVQCVYYKDTASAATKEFTLAPQCSNGRVAQPINNIGGRGKGIFHSVKCTMTTNDETVGFEPIALVLSFKLGEIRQQVGIT